MNDIESMQKKTEHGRWEPGFYCKRCKTFTNKYVYKENSSLIQECTKCHQKRILHYDHTGKDPFSIDHHLYKQYKEHEQLKAMDETHEQKQE